MKTSQSHFHDIRGLRYHVRTWGDPSHPRLFLLHGWMDVSASFQFLVDCLQRDWYLVAPDWRGFGQTQWAQSGYWFPDYYADLERLLDHYEPDAPALLVGHSMGGLVALTYAGIHPERVRRLVSLEGFGLTRTRPQDAPARYRRWLSQLREPPRLKPYASFDEVAARLMKGNRRLKPGQARFLAQHWARQNADGSVELASDPRHKAVNPVLFRLEENIACWNEVTAPTLWVFARNSERAGYLKDTPAELAERTRAFRDYTEVWIDDCGHMMHHDQPEQLAHILETFLTRAPGAPKENGA